MVTLWQADGDFTVLVEKHRKCLISQRFIDGKGKVIEWTLFHGNCKSGSVIILPITADQQVVVIEEFKFGSGKKQIELPCGNTEENENIEEAAARELLEETGYMAKEIISLMPSKIPIWIDTSSATGKYHPFLAIGCERAQEQTLDETEEIDIKIIPLQEWLEMTEQGEIDDAKTLVTTYLAERLLK